MPMSHGEGLALMSLCLLHGRKLRHLILYRSPLGNNRSVHKGKEYACHAWSHHAYLKDGIPQHSFSGILIVIIGRISKDDSFPTALGEAIRGSFIYN